MLFFTLMICNFCLFESIMDPITLELPNVQWVLVCEITAHVRWCCNLIIICGPFGCLVGRMFLWVLRMLFQNLQNFKGGHST